MCFILEYCAEYMVTGSVREDVARLCVATASGLRECCRIRGTEEGMRGVKKAMVLATLVSMSRAANGAAAMGERGLLSSAFAVSPDLSFSPFRSCQKSGTFRGNVEVQSRGIANAGMRSKRTRAGFMQGVVAAAKDVWSIAGANTARQAMMGMGAGVATEDVLTVRHDTEGTGIELWHGSFGWFDFMAYDGASIVLSDTWGIQIERPIQAFPSGGQQYSMLRQMAKKGNAPRMPETTIKAGTWTAAVLGEYIVIKNQYAKRQILVLTDDGFVFLGSRGVSLAVLKGGDAEEMSSEEAMKLLPDIDLKMMETIK